MAIVLPSALDAVDARLSAALDRISDGRADSVAHALSSMADRSLLWVGLAVLRCVRGRPGDRRAAVRMVVVVGVESAVVHGAVKRLFRRERPATERMLRFGARRPPSSSFPSGHSASAVTAAMLLADGTPYGAVLYPLAGGVAWSRVQTRLHHPTDVMAGALLGFGIGVVARRLVPLRSTVR